jgi:hypothetical protein
MSFLSKIINDATIKEKTLAANRPITPKIKASFEFSDNFPITNIEIIHTKITRPSEIQICPNE